MINNKGIELIKSYESLRLKSYICPAGVLTVGFGHTGKDVKPNMIITESQANELLDKDIDNVIIQLKQLIKVELNENQYSAIVSLVFNIGIGAFKSSTILKKINLNPNSTTIKDEFMRWIYANKIVLKGLVKRRTSEVELYYSK